MMKFKIFPPAAIKTDDSLTVNGRAKAFFVRIHPSAPESTLPHELCHVWQWWAITAIVALIGLIANQPLLYILAPSVELLLSFVPHYRLLRECMAHAVSAKHKDDPLAYIERQSEYMVSERSSYKALHRFKAEAARKMMSFFFKVFS